MQERKIYDWFSGIAIFILVLSLVGTQRLQEGACGDIEFLWNRVVQLKNSDSILGVFFYNDFLGVGYGSSFFYGYLTLVPFTLFNDYSAFCNAFILVTLVLLLFGSRSLIKCYCSNYKYISFLFISGVFLITSFCSTTLYANFYAIGISFFFLSYCIQFFRDEKSFVPAGILFFLVLNTHMITAFLSFVGCVLLLIKYFDKRKWKQYLNFFLFTCLICMYFIVNFLYHSEGALSLGIGRDGFLSYYTDVFKTNNVGVGTFSGSNPLFFGGLFAAFLVKPQCASIIFSPLVFILGLVFFIKGKPKKSNIVLMCTILISFILSIHYIWMFLYSKFNIILQFPLRYLPYAVVLFLILCFRNNNKLSRLVSTYSLVLCIVSSFLFSSLSFLDSTTFTTWQVGNGEYLGDSFVRNEKVFLELKDSCEFEYEKDGRYTTVYVDKETTDWVRVPKLWYKGYKAVTEDGKELECKMGYSQFVEFNPEGYVGEVTVYYAHTWWLYILEVFCYCLVIFNLGKLFLKLINKYYTFFGSSLFKNRKEISNE